MTCADEETLLAAVVAAQRRRDPEAMAALLDAPVESLLDGAAGSRVFTGVAFDLLCRALLWDGGKAGAAAVKRLCARSEARFGPQPWSILYRACLALRAGRWSRAAALYPTAGGDPAVLWKRSGGCRSVVSPEACDRWRAAPIAAPAIEVVRRGDAGHAVLLAACDHRYLRTYAAAWLRSIAEHAPDCAVHLHLVDPADDDIAWTLTVAGSLALRPTLSTEAYRGPDARAWYASVRFLRLAEVVEHATVPVLASDVDALFTRPFTIDMADRDAMLMRKRTGFRAHPWHAIQAGAVAVAPTAPGRTFARTLAALTTGIFAERAGEGIWFVDQNLLFAADRRLSDDVRIGAFGGAGLPGGLRFDKALLAPPDSDASRPAGFSLSPAV